MGRTNVGEIKNKFIEQIADAERKVEVAKQNRDIMRVKAKQEYDDTIAGSEHDVTMAEAHLAGMKAALSLFEPKRATSEKSDG